MLQVDQYLSKPKYKVYTLIISIVLILAGCGGNETNNSGAETVDIFENFIPIVSATGKVVPEQWATLSLPGGGVVVHVHEVRGLGGGGFQVLLVVQR